MNYKTIDFSKFSSIKIGSIIDVALIENDIVPQNHTMIGLANNILISPTPPPLMMLSKEYSFIEIDDNKLRIGAATPSGKIASFTKKHNIAHFEYCSKLPGSLGGMIKMNAGLKEYEIFNYLIAIKTESGWKQKDEINYGYRYTDIDEVIFEAIFELHSGYDIEKFEMFNKMRANQPSTASAGSCFKNPVGDYAGRLIESVGLKGIRRGAMEFSSVHANFLVNHGGGTYEDAMYLINEAKKRVLESFNITLECEIIII